MRQAVISFLILMGCGREDPAIDIVRLPQTAYGPFDAEAVKPVASADAGADSGAKDIPTSQVDCYVPDGVAEEEETASAPFDNCPAMHGGGRFNEKATSQRRQRNRDTCCYTVVRRKQRVIRLDEVE